MAIHLTDLQLKRIHHRLEKADSNLIILDIVGKTPYYRKYDYTFWGENGAAAVEQKVNFLLLILAAEEELADYKMRAVK